MVLFGTMDSREEEMVHQWRVEEKTFCNSLLDGLQAESQLS